MMNKKGEGVNWIVILLGALILIFIGIALINSVADTKSTQTKLLSIANESFSLTNCYMLNSSDKGWNINVSDVDCNKTVSTWYTGTDWRLNESQCYLSAVTVKNGSSTTLVANTDYRLWSNMGKIQFLNTGKNMNNSGNLSFIAYSYCDSGYLQSSGDRSLADLWTTIMIIALLVGLVIIAMKMYNEK
jgi:hypothetical protein